MKELTLYKADVATEVELPFAENGIKAGFPSPSQDYVDVLVDLNKELIPHPSSTFLAKVDGDSMIDAGIKQGDILIIDKSLEPKHGSVVVAYIEGEFTLKRLDLSRIKEGRIILHPENPEYPDFYITPEDKFTVWGVVSSVIHRL